MCHRGQPVKICQKMAREVGRFPALRIYIYIYMYMIIKLYRRLCMHVINNMHKIILIIYSAREDDDGDFERHGAGRTNTEAKGRRVHICRNK